MNNHTEYDVVVIGSGIGSLTAAGLLAKLCSKRILLLERHTILGGYTHSFSRKGYSWDTGLHYVGEMGCDSFARKVFDCITDGKLVWRQIPSPIDRFLYPDFNFDMPEGEEQFCAELEKIFPGAKRAIRLYLEGIEKAAKYDTPRFLSKALPEYLAWIPSLFARRHEPFALQTTDKFLASITANEKLRALLVSQWGDYGLPPSKSPLFTHAMVVRHYMNGAWIPEPGPSAIAKSIEQVIESAGGKLLPQMEVNRVILEGNKAVGVSARNLKSGENSVFMADSVISGIGALPTYRNLLPEGMFPEEVRRMEEVLPDETVVSLFIGLNRDPSEMGFDKSNIWIYESYAQEMNDEALFAGKPAGCFLSFGSLKHGTTTGKHSAIVFSLVNYNSFNKWFDTKWQKRGEDYKQLKERISQGLITLIESRYPGFTDMVEYYELGTPLSTEHFTGHPKGAIYGLGGSAKRFRLQFLGARSKVKRLYLAGADVLTFGIVGSLMGGVLAAGEVKGAFGFFRLMSHLTSR